MKKWKVEADGVIHEIQYKRGFNNKIIVDGETYKVKSSNIFVNVIDYVISFGDTHCNLVVIGSKVDLAVNGTFLGSNKPYEPTSNVSPWIWVLVGLSTIGGMLLSGILSLAIGVIMSTFYIQFGMKKKNGATIGCFIGCTLIQILIFFVIVLAQL
ncbi:hypothetical protein [Clostridium cellulovorans]|uniref:Uncharacterized protein n=1 Tax=Clostridium cellulovorans (strain ATCC 35296 / DSM 3052 / OCM 3 / 743B) TaxID=573061 RepID=D9SV95_CLOC7|nr:hypothetical protein [Clostridium cellulovorans]ADL53069.1 hypothetical protein Clocel_3390 [Clostridium cellulovorans 743B]